MPSPAGVSVYNFGLVIHILAVVVTFGQPLTYPLLLAGARRGGPGATATLHHVQGMVGARIVAFGGTVVLLAGPYLALTGPYAFGDPWIGATLAILVVVLGLSSAYLAPRDRRLARLAQDGPRAEYDTLLRRVGLVGVVSALLVLVAVFLMVTKPGA